MHGIVFSCNRIAKIVEEIDRCASSILCLAIYMAKLIALFTELIDGSTCDAGDSILFAPRAKTPKMSLVSTREFIPNPDNRLMGRQKNNVLYQSTHNAIPFVTIPPYSCIGHALFAFIIVIFVCHCPYSL